MAFVAAKYALRSVGRNARRTMLAVVGIAIGCSLSLVMESINRGRDELFARMGAYSGSGHLRIVPAAWPERRDPRLRLADWPIDVAAARALAGVRVVTVRARAQVLLAMGSHAVGLEMTGVDPQTEPRTYRFVQQVQHGRYLRSGELGTIVIGKAIADRLRADVDDEILASVVGQRGDIESAMFRIVGIVETGTEDIDMTICQVSLPDLERLTGRQGAGEVTVILNDWRTTDAARDALASHVARGDRVLTWGELNPEFKGHMDQDKVASRVITGIILLIVLLGVASAQLAAVLERRREFAVLTALGTSAVRMIELLLLEAVTLGVAGAVGGLAIGLPLVLRLERTGLDLRSYMGSNYTFGGTIFEPIIYGDFGAWIVPYVLVVSIGASVLASLYPAWFAVRTDPAVALHAAP